MIAEQVDVPAWALSVGAWVAGIGITLGGLIRLVPKFRELWINIRNVFRDVDAEAQAKIDLRASMLAYRRIQAIENVLERWVPRKGAQRAMLLVANDHGEAWTGKGPLEVSNPAQVTGAGEPNTWQNWQQWACDAWYTKWLHKLLLTLDSRRGMLLVRDVDVEGELHDAYQTQGTVASVVLPFRWQAKSVLWYVSINFGRAPKAPDGSDHPHTPDEQQAYLATARELYGDAGRCRALVDELRAAYDSVR